MLYVRGIDAHGRKVEVTWHTGSQLSGAFGLVTGFQMDGDEKDEFVKYIPGFLVGKEKHQRVVKFVGETAERAYNMFWNKLKDEEVK